ncbi:hypothetical protein BVX98_06330, partial [bacterium F11]
EHNHDNNPNEFHGITSQGDGSQSPYLRKLRQVYFYYQSQWIGEGGIRADAGGSRDIVDSPADGIINSAELNLIGVSWQLTEGNPNYKSEVDFREDQTINALDLNELAQRWLAKKGDERYRVEYDVAGGEGTEEVTLNGSASISSGGPIIAYRWYRVNDQGEREFIEDNVEIIQNLSLGEHTFALEIENEQHQTDDDVIVINIEDPAPGEDNFLIEGLVTASQRWGDASIQKRGEVLSLTYQSEGKPDRTIIYELDLRQKTLQRTRVGVDTITEMATTNLANYLDLLDEMYQDSWNARVSDPLDNPNFEWELELKNRFIALLENEEQQSQPIEDALLEAELGDIRVFRTERTDNGQGGIVYHSVRVMRNQDILIDVPLSYVNKDIVIRGDGLVLVQYFDADRGTQLWAYDTNSNSPFDASFNDLLVDWFANLIDRDIPRFFDETHWVAERNRETILVLKSPHQGASVDIEFDYSNEIIYVPGLDPIYLENNPTEAIAHLEAIMLILRRMEQEESSEKPRIYSSFLRSLGATIESYLFPAVAAPLDQGLRVVAEDDKVISMRYLEGDRYLALTDLRATVYDDNNIAAASVPNLWSLKGCDVTGCEEHVSLFYAQERRAGVNIDRPGVYTFRVVAGEESEGVHDDVQVTVDSFGILNQSELGSQNIQEREGSHDLSLISLNKKFNPERGEKGDIDFNLSTEANVKIHILNQDYHIVDRWGNAQYGAGHHILQWDGSGLPSGSYHVWIYIDGKLSKSKIIISK